MSSSGGGGGGGGVPPGFRFHPTDEELLHYYLKKKISFQKFDMEVIREVDLNKIEPWDLQEKCKIGSTPQNEWYFFSHKDRKYPTGSRTNRATHAGFWKATGRDKCIRNSFNKIGMRKTLVFYRGRAPHGQKTDWIMHEYRLEDPDDTTNNADDDGWVVCRVFKKKNLFKVVVGNEGGSSINSSSDQHPLHNNNNNNHSSNNNTSSFIHRSSDNQYLFRPPQTYATFELNKSDLALHYMPPHTYSHLYQSQTPNMNISTAANAIHNHKVPLSGYDYPALSLPLDAPIMIKQLNFMTTNPREAESGMRYQSEFEVGTSGHEADGETETEGMNVNESWAVLDRLVTSHLGSVGNEESSKEAVRFENENGGSVNQMNHLPLRGEMDFWGYAGK